MKSELTDQLTEQLSLADRLILVAGSFTDYINIEQRKENPNAEYIYLLKYHRASIVKAIKALPEQTNQK